MAASSVPVEEPTGAAVAERMSTNGHNEPVLYARDLWKVYGGQEVVREVSFSLSAGEVLGFLGPNGAGKTTTVGMLYGAVVPTRGETVLGQWSIPRQGRTARQQMGIVTQEDNLDPDFDARENLIMFAHHYRLRGRAAAQRVEELLERVGLTEHAHKQVDELSGGLKRRLVLARALINRPRVVFLDEPTTGLDPDSRQDFWRLVADLRNEGCGVILTTHYMDEAQRLCDRLILMQEGRQVEEGTPAELIERVVGREVVEMEGVDDESLRTVAQRFGTWTRPFGSGWMLSLPVEKVARDGALRALEELESLRLARRRANLEDVFLRLTGGRLD